MSKEQRIKNQHDNIAAKKHPAERLWLRVGYPVYSSAGFTLVELIVVTAIISILAAIAVPTYKNFINLAQNARTRQEIRTLEMEIIDYQGQNSTLPANLLTINRAALTDPWGNSYVYSLTLTRNRFGVLLNDDFDLYSMGRDGLTEAEVFGGGGSGKDDVLRGATGAFVGLGLEW